MINYYIGLLEDHPPPGSQPNLLPPPIYSENFCLSIFTLTKRNSFTQKIPPRPLFSLSHCNSFSVLTLMNPLLVIIEISLGTALFRIQFNAFSNNGANKINLDNGRVESIQAKYD